MCAVCKGCCSNTMILIRSLCFQADHPVCVPPHADRHAGLRLNPQPGSPVGGVYHGRTFRVGNH